MADLIYLSLGAGVQSSALYVMAVKGDLGRVDCAIFADTQAEPKHVYEQLDRLEKFGAAVVPIHRVTAGDLHADSLGSGFMSLPAFSPSSTGGKSMLRRQCTHKYKIAPIERKVRSLLGLKKGQRWGLRSATCLIGISMDEVVRMKPSRTKGITNSWPLVDKRLYRRDCEQIVIASGLPMPRRSACYFCPFKSNAEWRDLRDSDSESWSKAVDFDSKFTDQSRADKTRPVFIHPSMLRLSVAPIDDTDTAQSKFLWDQECEGMCGV